MKNPYQFQIVKEERQPFGHMLYFLRHKGKNGLITEYWVGASKLKRYYQQGKIIGPMGNTVRYVVGKEPRRKRMTKTEEKELIEKQAKEFEEGPVEEVVEPLVTEPAQEPVKSFWLENKPVLKFEPPKFKLPDEWVAPNLTEYPATGRAYVVEKDGKYCVVYPDGSLDEDWTPERMAKDYADSLNKEIEEKL